MRTHSLIFLVFLFMLSCSTREPSFDFNARSDFRVDLGLSIIETHNYVKSNVIIPLEASIQNLGFSTLDVTEVVPFEARIQPRFNDNVNLDFINSVNIYLIEPDNLRRREIFYAENLPFGQKTDIELIPTLLDITPYIQNDRGILEVSIELRQFPPTSFEMDVLMNFAGFVSE